MAVGWYWVPLSQNRCILYVTFISLAHLYSTECRFGDCRNRWVPGVCPSVISNRLRGGIMKIYFFHKKWDTDTAVLQYLLYHLQWKKSLHSIFSFFFLFFYFILFFWRFLLFFFFLYFFFFYYFFLTFFSFLFFFNFFYFFIIYAL